MAVLKLYAGNLTLSRNGGGYVGWDRDEIDFSAAQPSERFPNNKPVIVPV